MKKYKRPEHHFIRNLSGLSGDELSRLSNDELSRYLDNEDFQQERKMYRIRSGYILREIAGEYAIIPVDVESPLENTMMSPNASAVFIWKCFEEPSTIEDVVKKGLLEYNVTEEVLRRAVESFVADTLEYKILEEEERYANMD